MKKRKYKFYLYVCTQCENGVKTNRCKENTFQKV